MSDYIEDQYFVEGEGEEVFGNMINIIPKTCNQIEIFLDEEIGPPAKYRQMIQLLNTATEEDEVVIYFNSKGGWVDSAFAIIEAIKNTRANVVANVVGSCFSAASFILMYCHEFIIGENAYMMIHLPSEETGGNTHSMATYVEFNVKQVNAFMEKTYRGFIDATEMEHVKKGVELWFNSDEIKERLKGRVKVLDYEIYKEE